MNATILLVAHGTRDEAGLDEIGRVADAVRARFAPAGVEIAYVDVLGPSISDVLAVVPGPVVVVPLFLAAGYHVLHDVPAGVAASGRSDVLVTSALGPDPALTGVLRDRLEQVARAGDRVVLAAAGSSHERALREVELVARWFARICGGTVEWAYLSAAEPRVADLVAGTADTADTTRPVGSAGTPDPACSADTVVLPYLLAPGYFQRKAAASGARATAGVLGAHPAVIDVIADRYRAALARSAFHAA